MKHAKGLAQLVVTVSLGWCLPAHADADALQPAAMGVVREFLHTVPERAIRLERGCVRRLHERLAVVIEVSRRVGRHLGMGPRGARARHLRHVALEAPGRSAVEAPVRCVGGPGWLGVAHHLVRAPATGNGSRSHPGEEHPLSQDHDAECDEE